MGVVSGSPAGPKRWDKGCSALIGERRFAGVKNRVVCPRCNGEKKISHHGSPKRIDCQQCKGRGYLAVDRGDIPYRYRQPLKPRPPGAKQG